MIKADGSYPTSPHSTHGPWSRVCRIPQSAANTILLRVAIDADETDLHFDGAGHVLVNKCFRVFDRLAGKLSAVYNHDGNYSIIQCPEEKAVNLHVWKAGNHQ